MRIANSRVQLRQLGKHKVVTIIYRTSGRRTRNRCQSRDPPPSDTAPRLFEDATAIVESEFGADLSLDDIARRVASSRRQLQRAYAEIGHTTFREHLTAVRMERAGELLTSRGLTVREVAHRVGYRQPAQFAKAFRRHHGAAPSAFRSTHRFTRADVPVRSAAA